jgi:hypothetical protein
VELAQNHVLWQTVVLLVMKLRFYFQSVACLLRGMWNVCKKALAVASLGVGTSLMLLIIASCNDLSVAY